MSDKSQLSLGAGKIKSSTSLPSSAGAAATVATTSSGSALAADTPSAASDAIASHIRLSNIFAPLIDLNASGSARGSISGGSDGGFGIQTPTPTTDYDSTTLHSLQSTMSSSSSSNPVSVIFITNSNQRTAIRKESKEKSKQ